MERRFAGERFTLGLSIGVAIGAATGSMALWMGIGAVMGVAFAASARRQHCLPGRQVDSVDQ